MERESCWKSGGESGHGVARPDAVIHRLTYMFNHNKMRCQWTTGIRSDLRAEHPKRICTSK